MNVQTWDKLDKEIKSVMRRNGLTHELIKEPVEGELNEMAIRTSHGIETLFYGNGEAHITVEVDGEDYEFSYVVDRIGFNEVITNF